MAPPAEKASIRIPLPLDDAGHRELQRETLDIESNLQYGTAPYKHEAQYLNLPAAGHVPEPLKHRVGPAYDRVSFFVQKGDAYQEPNVSLLLMGKTMYQQATISSVPGPSPAGYLKPFALTPYGSPRATTMLDCAEFGWLVDSLLDQQTNMNQLADPRNGLSFEAIALDMSRQIGALTPARSKSTSTKYIGRDYKVSSLAQEFGLQNDDYRASDEFIENGTILEISEKSGASQLDLSLQAPYALGRDVLTAFFRYKFDRPRLIKSGRQFRPQETGKAEATFSFGSETLPRTTVAAYMENSRHCFNAVELGRHALANLDTYDRR